MMFKQISEGKKNMGRSPSPLKFTDPVVEESIIEEFVTPSKEPTKIDKTGPCSPYMSSKIDKAFSYMSNLEKKANKNEKVQKDEYSLRRTILCENYQ